MGFRASKISRFDFDFATLRTRRVRVFFAPASMPVASMVAAHPAVSVVAWSRWEEDACETEYYELNA